MYCAWGPKSGERGEITGHESMVHLKAVRGRMFDPRDETGDEGRTRRNQWRTSVRNRYSAN